MNSANADMMLKEHLNCFWEMEALDIESNSVHKAFKNEILTESIVLHLYFLNLITNQYRTILCYQSMAYIHLKINYIESQILSESTMKSFRKGNYWKSIRWEDTRKNSLFAPQSKKKKQTNKQKFALFSMAQLSVRLWFSEVSYIWRLICGWRKSNSVSIFQNCVWIDLQPVSFECYN